VGWSGESASTDAEDSANHISLLLSQDHMDLVQIIKTTAMA
jgi:hypothetical protein